MSASALSTRTIAGVSNPDTPIVNAAIAFARANLNDFGYNHVMRSILFSITIASKLPTFASLDTEVVAVGAILHDLGWSHNQELISTNKRFEIDGAIAARKFLAKEAPDWEPRRVQLVWDAIALHTTNSIALEKEAEVAAVSKGITADFAGPEFMGFSWADWDRIVGEFPRLKLVSRPSILCLYGIKALGYASLMRLWQADGVIEIIGGFCRTKPETTYDNFAGDVGDRLVEGYSRKGKRYVLLLQVAYEKLFAESAIVS